MRRYFVMLLLRRFVAIVLSGLALANRVFQWMGLSIGFLKVFTVLLLTFS